MPAAAAARSGSRRRHVAPGDALPRPGAQAVERRLRPAIASSGRWPFWAESESPVQASPVSSHPEAVTRRSAAALSRSEEHTSELQSLAYLVCRLLLEKKKIQST